MIAWIILSLVFFTLFIIIWVKGLTLVRNTKPDWVVPFYFAVAAMRILMALAIVVLYLLFAEHTHEEAVIFCIAFALMYVAMVTVSIVIKH